MKHDKKSGKNVLGLGRRTGATLMIVACALWVATPQRSHAQEEGKKPNILVIWGDDVGIGNVSAYTMGCLLYTSDAADE